jgi:hypothetical protein
MNLEHGKIGKLTRPTSGHNPKFHLDELSSIIEQFGRDKWDSKSVPSEYRPAATWSERWTEIWVWPLFTNLWNASHERFLGIAQGPIQIRAKQYNVGPFLDLNLKRKEDIIHPFLLLAYLNTLYNGEIQCLCLCAILKKRKVSVSSGNCRGMILHQGNKMLGYTESFEDIKRTAPAS